MAKTPKTILVVEDDKTVQQLLRETLEQVGYLVACESDGDWALKTFDKRPVDLCVLDALVPVINGFQVAAQIRERPKGRHVPIVMVSGIYRGPRHRKEAEEKYGVAAYLEKPLRMGELAALVQNLLGDRLTVVPGPVAEEEATAVARRVPLPSSPGPSRVAAVATEEEATQLARPNRLADAESRQEKRDVERLAKAGFTGAQVARGNLSGTPFPEVVAQLYRWRATGALFLRRDNVKKIVFLKDGYPTCVKSNLLSECLGKIMVREKMLSEEDCERSAKRMKATGRQQGTILVEAGLISPHNLVYALQLQMETKIFDVFGWPEGDYGFNPRAESPPATVQLDTPVASLILEGVRRTWDATRLERNLQRHAASFLAPHPDPLQRLQDLQLSAAEEAFVSRMDGTQTVASLLAAPVLGREDRLVLCYALLAAQMVEPRPSPSREEPVRPGTPPAPPTPDAVPAERPGREPRAPEPVSLAPPPLPRPPPLPAGPPPLRRGRTRGAEGKVPVPGETIPVVLEETALSGPPAGMRPPAAPPPPRERPAARDDRDEVERLAARVKEMRRMNHFEQLGVSKHASPDEVRKAYFSQAKDYHPDKHAGTHSAEVKALADQVYSLLTAAYHVLSDDSRRETYRKGLTSGAKTGVSDEVSRILAAEARFQRGESHMKRKDWPRAVACFQEAVDLYPDEGEFHGYLGWSLFQADPKDAGALKQVESHLAQALHLNPKLDRSYLFMGWVYKATGRRDLAEKQFEKAIQCNPDCTDALRELRLLSSQREQSALLRRKPT
jgi:CheY-like chemotaxis protein